jgi:hypothetical protein
MNGNFYYSITLRLAESILELRRCSVSIYTEESTHTLLLVITGGMDMEPEWPRMQWKPSWLRTTRSEGGKIPPSWSKRGSLRGVGYGAIQGVDSCGQRISLNRHYQAPGTSRLEEAPSCHPQARQNSIQQQLLQAASTKSGT